MNCFILFTYVLGKSSPILCLHCMQEDGSGPCDMTAVSYLMWPVMSHLITVAWQYKAGQTLVRWLQGPIKVYFFHLMHLFVTGDNSDIPQYSIWNSFCCYWNNTTFIMTKYFVLWLNVILWGLMWIYLIRSFEWESFLVIVWCMPHK